MTSSVARPPAQRLACQPADHRVARGALGPAAVTRLVRFDDDTGKHGPVGLESLPDDGQTYPATDAPRDQATCPTPSSRTSR